jgi:hypothetical protein
MITKYYLYLFMGCAAIVSSCSNSASKSTDVAAPTATQAPKIMEPFRFHKTVEVAPGQYYDVLGWGRGSQSVGAFEILRSDSAAMKYTTTTGDLDGRIVEVLNADMDTDGNPEIFIHAQAVDSTNAAKVYAFEYNDERARELEFPKLTRSQRKGYRGNDNFFVKEGNLMREFNVYEESDSLSKKPIQKRLIEYTLRGNSLSGNQVSTDSTSKEKAVAPVAAVSNNTRTNSHSSRVSNRSTRKRSVTKKRQTSRKKETRKRHRRRN